MRLRYRRTVRGKQLLGKFREDQPVEFQELLDVSGGQLLIIRWQQHRVDGMDNSVVSIDVVFNEAALIDSP